MLNKGTDLLDELVGVGRKLRDMTGLGFDKYKGVKTDPKKTNPPKKKLQEQMSNHMSQNSAQQKKQKSDHMSHHHAQHVSP
ncbi:hypothetical protein A2U01_0064970 [Trifolium medium]|uniref:Uncharacterized protein n=1 Tax=Trifolium medium TaxID=97028 RepID=A0A392S5N2_9FABA|nr:hypothetical protein [Trifolium medium]